MKKISLIDLVLILYCSISIFADNTGTLIVKLIRLLTCGVLLMYLFCNKVIRFNNYVKWSFLFFGYMLLTYFWAFSKPTTLSYVMSLFYVIIIDVLFSFYIINNKSKIDIVLKTIIFSSILKSLFVFGKFGFLVFINSRSAGVTSANSIGIFTAFSVFFSLYLLNKNKNKMYIIPIILNTIFCILSSSRKGLLCLILPSLIYYFVSAVSEKKYGKSTLIIFGFSFITILTYLSIMNIPMLYNSIGNRVESMINGILHNDGDNSVNTRLSLVEFGISMFKQRPIYGFGMYGFAELYGYYNPWSKIAYYAHNNYIELLVDGGLIGLVIYYSLFIYLIIYYVKDRKKTKLQNMGFSLLITFLVIDIGMVSFYEIFNQLLLLISYCLIEKRRINYAKVI